MRRSKPRQLSFGFADNPQGDVDVERADESATKASSSQTPEQTCRKVETPETGERASGLLVRVAELDNLEQALKKVASNRGSPGIDGRSVREVVAGKGRILPRLSKALLSKGYQPGDIRRVWIDKPGGGQRGLGIPNVVDRVAQQAVLQVLEPIFEPTFHPSSHGFRPGRGTQTAIAESIGHLKAGHGVVVDIDLASFFDRVHQQRLLERMSKSIADRDLLRLIGRMLKAKVVLPDGMRTSTEEGVPQGGPLSPLLSNIVLDELDHELDRRGHRFVRYADDVRVFVCSMRAGERTMTGLRRFIVCRLRLKVNETKSAVDRSRKRPFLGLEVGITRRGRPVIRPSKRSLNRINVRVRELTRRNVGRSLESCMERLNRYLRGWMAYFQICSYEARRTLQYLDAHIRRRLRAIAIKQKKRPRHLFRFLLSRGVSRGAASTVAFSRRGPWWQSTRNGIHRAFPNAWFETPLTSLVQTWQQKRKRQAGLA